MANEVDTTLLDNLNSIKSSKADIKQAIIDKGQQATDVFADYAQLISNIQTGEDLTDVLTAQEQKLAQLEATLENKTAGESKSNIFVQNSEPDTKDGIWLKKEATPEHYIYDDEVFIGGEWMEDGTHRNIPFSFSHGVGTVLGTDVFLFCQNTAYKYNTLTDTYIQLPAGAPTSIYDSSAVTIGTDIYLLGGSNGNRVNSKYNTLTGTYTGLAQIPYNFYHCSAVAIGTDIYLLGYYKSPYNYNYKYDTLTNTYAKLTDIPYQPSTGVGAVAIGTNIFIFGGGYGRTTAYKYDTLTDTYTQLANIPYNFIDGSVVAVGTNIYLFGGNTSPYNQNYKYDTLTDTYTQLTNIPYNFYFGAALAMGNNIYLFGGYPEDRKVQVYAVESKTYQQDNSVVINQGRYARVGYEIVLYSNPKDVTSPKYAFADAWYYTTQGGLETDIPTYYGDGTQWIKFKN